MSRNDEEGPVYYREIQKNGYLKRIPNDTGSSKLRPLGHKKPALKPLWTLFCVHNGRTPYLEQYPSPESPCALAHRPLWRASLRQARHVTASVKPHVGSEHDFLIHTDSGGVRMLAPDWESMQAWVQCLRVKLHELRELPAGENVYCAPPAPPAAPRAPCRDPTSPLPPTPRPPPARVPGIELNTPRPTPLTEVAEQPETTTDPTETTTEHTIDSQSRTAIDNSPRSIENLPRSIDNLQSRIAIDNSKNRSIDSSQSRIANDSQSRIDISDWESTLNINSMPSTSHEKSKCEPQKSVAKICGQNICLDDSIFKRSEATESDEEFCNEILDSAERQSIDSGEQSIDCPADIVETSDVIEDYTQRLVLSSGRNVTETTNGGLEEQQNSGPPSNVTVIVVDNKQAASEASDVTTGSGNQENGYGAVFSTEQEYGHISLTTTVNLQDGLYERLCMATTSDTPSPLPARKLQPTDKTRKSSLPNLDVEPTSSHNSTGLNNNSTYEYLFSDDHQTSINIDGANVVKINGVGRHVNSVTVGAGEGCIAREGRVERSHSQNACDSTRLRERLIRREASPKRDKVDKPEAPQSKPIWKRGLTELSLLSRLRGIAQAKRADSPTRHEPTDRGAGGVVVVHRSRAEARPDGGRRRSTSLSNGTVAPPPPAGSLPTLRVREAAWLLAEQTLLARVTAARSPLLFAYDSQLWVACWYRGARHGGRAGDRVLRVRGAPPRDLAHARALCKQQPQHKIDIVYNRVPLAKIYVLNKETEDESIGITLDSECAISGVTSGSPCARAGAPPPGHWAVTEVNNRPLNLVKGAQADMARLSACGKEVSVLLQPAPLVRRLRQALKQNRGLLALR